MKSFCDNIEALTKKNDFFRQVLFTGTHAQLVVMSLKPGEEIGAEIHPNLDQFFRFESGEGKVIVDGQEHLVKDGSAVIVPAGANHNIINLSADQPLKLYTIYSPPNHPDKTIHQTKAEAMTAEHQEHA